MTAGELIAILSTLPPDTPVIMFQWPWSEAEEGYDGDSQENFQDTREYHWYKPVATATPLRVAVSRWGDETSWLSSQANPALPAFDAILIDQTLEAH